MDEKRFALKEATFMARYGSDPIKAEQAWNELRDYDQQVRIITRLTKQDMQRYERRFFDALRAEMKAQKRKTQRTSSATRTMSKRKRAGSRRWPVR